MKASFLFIVALMICATSMAQIKLEKRSFLNGKLELMVPAEFKQMEQAVVESKYANSKQRPDVVLTNESASINVVISHFNDHLEPSQVREVQENQLNSLKKNRPDGEWLDAGVKKINDKDVGYIKFIIMATDQKVFNYMFFTELDGRSLLISFNCIEKKLPEWKDASEAIFSSITVK
jgi:hypothetical protein